MEGLYNMMEDNVEQKLNDLLPMMKQYCSCKECVLEMATYALNRLPAKYVHTDKGAVLHKFDTSSTQAEAEITSVVLQAIQVIGEKPNHGNARADGN